MSARKVKGARDWLGAEAGRKSSMQLTVLARAIPEKSRPPCQRSHVPEAVGREGDLDPPLSVAVTAQRTSVSWRRNTAALRRTQQARSQPAQGAAGRLAYARNASEEVSASLIFATTCSIFRRSDASASHCGPLRLHVAAISAGRPRTPLGEICWCGPVTKRAAPAAARANAEMAPPPQFRTHCNVSMIRAQRWPSDHRPVGTW